jgi:extracellular factor (EF) 3-hydroxypalmitic acid methyl ester biosynthesis protein
MRGVGAVARWIDDDLDPEAAVARLEASAARFLRLADARPRTPAALLHATAESLHQFSAAILDCEAAGVDRSTVLRGLGPLRALHARSPFVARLQTWPRGYPGDFETVEWLCDADNRAAGGTIAWAIEECALQSPIAQQHRNKVILQARAILAAVLARPQARIASIGCGGCRDLSLIEEFIPDRRGHFVLVDTDPGALAFARRRLPRLAPRCAFVAGSVPRILSRAIAAGPFDLVVAGGLFDYLPDRLAIATLRAVRRMLAPGGTLLFSNIAAGNPFRPWIEYLGDWMLIERSEADVAQLVRQAELPIDRLRLRRDSTSLALMADVTMPSSSTSSCSDPAAP